MKKKELLRKIEELEREVEELKARPNEFHYHFDPLPYTPYYPIYVGDPPCFPSYPWKYYTVCGGTDDAGTLTTGASFDCDSITTDTLYVSTDGTQGYFTLT